MVDEVQFKAARRKLAAHLANPEVEVCKKFVLVSIPVFRMLSDYPEVFALYREFMKQRCPLHSMQ